MGKTTNILDLNNRLTKVEKENVAQNSYTSLKNKPKINGVTLTGNKSLADIGAAAAADLSTKQNALRFITKIVLLPNHSSGNAWDYAEVSFGVTFKSQPLVTVFPYQTGSGPIPISLVEVTTTGCKIGSYRGASTGTYDFIINAVGEVAT